MNNKDSQIGNVLHNEDELVISLESSLCEPKAKQSRFLALDKLRNLAVYPCKAVSPAASSERLLNAVNTVWEARLPRSPDRVRG